MVRVIQAVILGEAIWGLLVSLTHSLVLPALARLMGGDPQAGLYFGKGDFDVAAIFSSILELCLAGIAALVLSYWSRPRTARIRVKAVKRAPVVSKTSFTSITAKGMPSILAAPATPAPVNAATEPVEPQAVAVTTATTRPIPPATSQPAPPVAVTAASVKPDAPAKPQKRKEVYYNIVGEPIYPTEEDN